MENIITLLLLGNALSPNAFAFDFNAFPIQIKEEARIEIQSPRDRSEILWLARIIYSETKKPEEMRLVGWVVRNRVETSYFGSTYETVAKSPNQFSGLSPRDAEYANNISLVYTDTKNGAWRQALETAKAIYYAPDSARALPISVRHFYSPQSTRTTPSWAKNKLPYSVIKRPTDLHARFSFYSDIK